MRRMWSAVALALMLGAVACGESGSSDSTLRVPYQDDPTLGIDPDVFYSLEGSTMIQALYEGLLTYEPNTIKLAPQLAESWKSDPSGSRYTFKLRPGVRFHDGTKLDSAAVKAAFERRAALKAPPVGLIFGVKRVRTPDARTVVVELEQPNPVFPHMLASSWGLKIISPTAINRHDKGDHAARWLAQHAAGTGPYKLTAYEPGRRFELRRFPGYWGSKPSFARIEIPVIADIGNQRLQLESGDLDMIVSGIPAGEVKTLESNPELEVDRLPTMLGQILYLNVHKAPLDNRHIRKALAQAFDADTSMRDAYGDLARLPHSAYPPELVDPKLAPVPTGGGPVRLDRRVPLSIAYLPVDVGPLRQLEQAEPRLEKAGFDVKLTPVTETQLVAFRNDPAKAPDALLVGANPDFGHPEGWARSLFATGGGLNHFAYSNPEADRLLNAAAASSGASAERLYGEAGAVVARDYGMLFLGYLDDAIVRRSNITGVEHTRTDPWSVHFSALRQE